MEKNAGDDIWEDEENDILYVGDVPMMKEGEHTPEYLTLLQFRLARVNAEIAKAERGLRILAWASAHPADCGFPPERIPAHIDNYERRMAICREWRASLVNNIAWIMMDTT